MEQGEIGRDVPPTLTKVAALADEVPGRYRAVVVL